MEKYRKAWLNERRFIESSFDFKLYRPTQLGIWSPHIIYGTLATLQVYSNIHLAKNAIGFTNIITVMKECDKFKDGDSSVIWCGSENAELTAGNITINLANYTKEQVIDILKKYIPASNFCETRAI